MKLSIKTTFDFGKLANKMSKIVEDYTTDTIKEESSQMKKRLSTSTTITGTAMDSISPTTEDIRKLKGSSGNKPMFDTGRLHKSVTPEKNGIKLNKYGEYHQNTHKTVTNKFTKWYFMETGKNIANKIVPARRWIHNNETFKHNKKITKNLFKRIKEALKK